MKSFFSILGRLVPVILSFLILGAHFSRNDHYVLVLLALAMIGLLFIRKPLIARIIQAALLLGGIEWLRSMFGYIAQRKETGEDWTRLAIILSIVAIFTVLSGLVFFSKRIKAHYKLK